MKRILYLIAVAILFVASCTLPKTEYKIGMMNFIEGKWGNVADTSNMFFEEWHKANDSTFIGHAFTINSANDTLFQEEVSLTERNGVIAYSPSVKDQNEGKAVPFVFTQQKGDEYWFVNEKHDFPKAIVYRKSTDDSLIASIEGVVFGEFRKEYFPMKKLK